MSQQIRAWPRLLRAEKAAAYCGVSINKFKKMVDLGEMPKPKMKSPGIVSWDRFEIDATIDNMSSENAGLVPWG